MGGALRADRRDLQSGPCFLGSVPQVLHDASQYCYCAGRVQTARVFCDDTVDQQPPLSPEYRASVSPMAVFQGRSV